MNPNEQDSIKVNLKNLMWQYSQIGRVYGSSLLLTPDIALKYADDLAAIGVANMGLSGWYYVWPDKSDAVAEQWGDVDFYVGDDTLHSENAAQESAKKIKEYLNTRLRDDTVFVSFTLDLPDGWFNELWPPSKPD